MTHVKAVTINQRNDKAIVYLRRQSSGDLVGVCVDTETRESSHQFSDTRKNFLEVHRREEQKGSCNERILQLVSRLYIHLLYKMADYDKYVLMEGNLIGWESWGKFSQKKNWRYESK